MRAYLPLFLLVDKKPVPIWVQSKSRWKRIPVQLVCFPKANATLQIVNIQYPDISIHLYSILLLSKLYQIGIVYTGMNNIEYYSFALQINTERSYHLQETSLQCFEKPQV